MDHTSMACRAQVNDRGLIWVTSRNLLPVLPVRVCIRPLMVFWWISKTLNGALLSQSPSGVNRPFLIHGHKQSFNTNRGHIWQNFLHISGVVWWETAGGMPSACWSIWARSPRSAMDDAAWCSCLARNPLKQRNKVVIPGGSSHVYHLVMTNIAMENHLFKR